MNGVRPWALRPHARWHSAPRAARVTWHAAPRAHWHSAPRAARATWHAAPRAHWHSAHRAHWHSKSLAWHAAPVRPCHLACSPQVTGEALAHSASGGRGMLATADLRPSCRRYLTCGRGMVRGDGPKHSVAKGWAQATCGQGIWSERWAEGWPKRCPQGYGPSDGPTDGPSHGPSDERMAQTIVPSTHGGEGKDDMMLAGGEGTDSNVWA